MRNVTPPEPDGAAIRDLRKARGLSQLALAAELGRTMKWVSNLETGNGDKVSLAGLYHVALFFGVKPAEITRTAPAPTPAAGTTQTKAA